MPLLDRVTTLVRANLNDLVEKAENPEKLLKQLLLDMQNQFMQVKTQVAIAIADQHLLEKKKQENLDAQSEWIRKAELAVRKNEEDLARIALNRSLTYENAAANFAQQLDDQSQQVQTLRDALDRLDQRMIEIKTRIDLLLAKHRRAHLLNQTGSSGMQSFQHEAAFERLERKVVESEAIGAGHLLASGNANADQRLLQLEKSDRVDRLLADLKGRLAGAGQ